ncbi:canalicular multispecific organic anion transporter 2-like [Tetranychus urticae]|uniref:canalicular multispecific organic anion transporter 2-like n=1 Tax=Tetranychus urticae TaxID=32264 RepID=UPI00077BAB5C|nr:canalicular multispecific organic anion transporter 2-like [Tetranychus urticae]
MKYSQNEIIYPYEYTAPVIRLCSFMIATMLLLFYKQKGVFTSGLLFLYWFFMAIQSSVNYWALIDSIQNPGYREWTFEQTDLVLKSIQLTSIILVCLLYCVADSVNENGGKEFNAAGNFVSSSFVSHLFFHWYDSMAYLGFKKALTQSDLWDLPEESRTKLIHDNFSELLTESQQSLKLMNAKKPLNKARSNLFRTLLKSFWPWLLACFILKLFSSLLAFASPQLLDLLLTFIRSNDPSWKGVILALGMFVAALLQSLFDSQYEFWIQTTSMRMRSALISAIYHKSLRLSGLGRRDYTSGEIVNIMAVDTQRIIDYVNIINVLWSAPVQICLSVTLLWFQLGVASIAGLIFMTALVPLNACIRGAIKNYQIKVMAEKDKRSKMVSEVLNGMKVLKLYAWEGAFEDMIMSIRQNEVGYLKKQATWQTVTNFLANFSPFSVSLVCFGTFVLIDSSNVLDANKAFVSLSLINLLRVPLIQLPMVVTYGANCIISMKRIDKYLQGDELDPNAVAHEPNTATPISVKNATFSWSQDEEAVLTNINIEVPQNKLIAIVGPVGSGKSSLLAALLGDLHKKQGSINVHGRIAYVPQTAWLRNATVRQNIVFGETFRQEKYNNVIEACALTPDMKILPGGDTTEIGERGINLSGGQKQRISIARAVYSNSDVYLLDDPLSAVDAHVASHLFDKVIGPKGLLKHKTRLLVTHRITFLPQVDQIIVMKDGKIHESGTYNELMAKKGEFADFIIQYLSEFESDSDLKDENPIMIEEMKASVKPELEARRASINALSRELSRLSIRSIRSASVLNLSLDKKMEESLKNHNIVTTEKAETGSVKFSVYLEFFQAVGVMAFVLTIFFYLVASGLTFSSTLWLTEWSDDADDPVKLNNTSFRLYRLGVYAALGTGSSLLILINTQIFAMALLNGANWIHNKMLHKIIRAPMSFFDTTPTGRILNRFTKDIDTTDTTIVPNFRSLFNLIFRNLVAMVGICMESGYLIFGIGIIGVIYAFIQKFYIASSRQLRRIESITRSPIYSHFSETITGSTSIRAYGATDHFIQECYRKVDTNHSSFFLNIGANRWLSIRLELFGNLIVTIAAFTAVATRGSSSAGSTGLALSYALQMTQILNFLIRQVSNVENSVVSIERCLEYTKIESEAIWIDDNNQPRKTWPEKGEIIFKNYSTRYREGLDLVLENIFCKIKPNEKVGIVGRTGAGKSSLTLALFRLVEPAQGTIAIDGEDICKFGLHDLRQRLTIIPQDPVLFSATFRKNFDPFHKYSDSEIWKALELANLKEYVASLESGLDYSIAEGGENLSVGQRQLVCLTRALLRKTQVLVLDEATAAVDVETDELIQETIRREFADCTIVTIAHRLNTIMDYDKIIVMDKGKIVEYDSPNNLLADKNSIFYSMAKEAKLVHV